jgi:hypothetical protein
MIGDGKAMIDDGVKAGETVVTAGQYRLQNGSLVQAGQVPQKTADKDP